MRLTVITPTIGRRSLLDTLLSIYRQLAPGDEHLVIGDGKQPEAAAMCSSLDTAGAGSRQRGHPHVCRAA